jgi:prepilin-type processing-associated H-X9-DG protein
VNNIQMFSCPGHPSPPELDRSVTPCEIKDIGYRQDAGDVPTQKPDFNGIPMTADPMRAVVADGSTSNHGGAGAEVLHADGHVKLERVEGTNKGVVPNSYLPQVDANIYEDQDPSNKALNQDRDCDLD